MTLLNDHFKSPHGRVVNDVKADFTGHAGTLMLSRIQAPVTVCAHNAVLTARCTRLAQRNITVTLDVSHCYTKSHSKSLIRTRDTLKCRFSNPLLGPLHGAIGIAVPSVTRCRCCRCCRCCCGHRCAGGVRQ